MGPAPGARALAPEEGAANAAVMTTLAAETDADPAADADADAAAAVDDGDAEGGAGVPRPRPTGTETKRSGRGTPSGLQSSAGSHPVPAAPTLSRDEP